MPGWLVLHPVSQYQLGVGVAGWDLGDEKKTAVLVPSGEMVQDLRHLLERKGMDPQAVIIQTFDRFVRSVAADRPRTLMSPVQQEWLVRQAIAQLQEANALHHHRHMTNKSGWLSRVEARIGEWKRAGIRPRRLSALWDKHRSHFEELSRIYATYQDLLEEKGLWDHEEPYFEGMERMRRAEAALPERVVVEHVPDLSVLQEQWLIQAVTQGVEVFLHLPWDAARPRLFQETMRTVERFRLRGFRLCEGGHESLAPKKGTVLNHLEKQLFHPRPQPREKDESLEVVAAAGVEEEVERMVARLKRWLEDSGCNLSEAAIVTQQPETYHPLLFPRLERAGLPVHQPCRNRLASHPLTQTVCLALRYISGWRRGWRVLLDSPYLPGDPPLDERLEWQRLYPDGDTLEEGQPQGLSGVVQWLRFIPPDETWESWVRWFGEWLRPIHPRARPGAFSREEWHRIAADLRAWEGLEEIRLEWERMLQQGGWGRRFCDATTFLSALEGALAKCWLTVRPGRRGGIRILEPNQIRGRRFRAVFLLGCAEGCWPRPVSPDWLVPDHERRRLQAEGVMVATSEEQRQRQRLPFFQSIQAADAHLVCSFPTVDDAGNPLLPSPYLLEMAQVFPALRENLKPKPFSWQDCATGEEAFRVALQSDDGGGEAGKWAKWRQNLPWKQDRPLVESWAVRVEAEQARRALQDSPFDGVLTSPLHKEWVKANIRETVWSATALNEAMLCPFHFFAGRILRVQPREGKTPEPSPLERGEFLHRILCRFWDRYREEPKRLLEEEEASAHLNQVVDQVWREEAQRRGWETLPPWYRLEKHRLSARLVAMVEHEQAWRKQKGVSPSFRPRWLEWGFGLGWEEAAIHRGDTDRESRSAPVQLELGEAGSIRIRGKVDRVDMDEAGRYVLYDYKSGAVPSARDVMAGHHLQLPLYLWVLQQEMGLDPEQAVGAAFYTAGTRKGESPPADNRNQGLWRAEVAGELGISSRVGGWLQAEEWESIQETLRKKIGQRLQELEQGRFATTPSRPCPATCPHRRVCRVDRRRLSKREGVGEGWN